MTEARRVFIGIGSNFGDRREHLRHAVAGLPDVVRVSHVYETETVDVDDQQPLHLNAVVELRTAVSLRYILDAAQTAENEAGRDRRTEQKGLRPLDVDVLWADGEQSDEPDLTVPHPRMRYRRFVLAPLAELAPDLVAGEELESAIGEVTRLDNL